MGYAEKNLAPGETILYRTRYHWVFYRFSIIVLILAAALAAASLYSRSEQAWNEIGRPLMWLAGGFVVIALIAYVMLRIRSGLDEFVVTTRRVIRKAGVFAREIQQAPIEKVQNITVEQGVLARILGYGTVIVETASENGMMVFPSVAGPDEMRNYIWRQAPPRPDTAAAAVESVEAVTGAQARLEELETLKQQGLVSPEEYATKRQQILSNL